MNASDALTALWRVLPWIDWVALAFFFAAWVGYASFAHRRAAVQPSLLALTNRERQRWMLQTTAARTGCSTAWWCRTCRPARRSSRRPPS